MKSLCKCWCHNVSCAVNHGDQPCPGYPPAMNCKSCCRPSVAAQEEKCKKCGKEEWNCSSAKPCGGCPDCVTVIDIPGLGHSRSGPKPTQEFCICPDRFDPKSPDTKSECSDKNCQCHSYLEWKVCCTQCHGDYINVIPIKKPKKESPDQADWENPIRRFYFGGGWSKEQLLEYISSLLARVRKEERERAAGIIDEISCFCSSPGHLEGCSVLKAKAKILTPEQPLYE